MFARFASSSGRFILLAVAIFCLTGEFAQASNTKDNEVTAMSQEIYYAGGCFWGAQEYFSRLPGVVDTEVGYAQSNQTNPTYDDVCGGGTNAAETVKVVYDPQKISLDLLTRHFLRIIDPLSLNRQGNDIGTQYRTGVYYTNPEDEKTIRTVMAGEQRKYDRPLAVELEPLRNFHAAEKYHQNYLKKNPGGYCHISFASLDDPDLAPVKAMDKETREKQIAELDPVARHITMENGTEPPFTGKYWDFDKPGIYVDVISGQPLFSSRDKFPSSCGWPAFSAPINPDTIRERPDLSHGMTRTEARSKSSDAHLGHIFNDGPREKGGLRYCINSAALRFVPVENMKKEGYGAWLPLIKE